MQIILPKLGLTMTHGTITEWLKQPGAAVRAGEPLCTYETEKATLELEAPEDGLLAEILVPTGAPTPVGTAVCVLETAAESKTKNEKRKTQGATRDADDLQQPAAADHPPSVAGQLVHATPKARAMAATMGVDLRQVSGQGPGGRIQAADVASFLPSSVAVPDHRAVTQAASLPPTPAGEIKATPLARRIAAAEGIDLRDIIGAGPEGTITREDVEAVKRKTKNEKRKTQPAFVGDHAPRSSAKPPSETDHAAETIIPLTGIRQIIAERMTTSAFAAPHVTLMTEAEATNLVSARRQFNDELTLPPARGGDRGEALSPARGGDRGEALPPARGGDRGEALPPARGGDRGEALPPARGGDRGEALPPAAAGGTEGGPAKISYNTLLAALVARALREHPRLNSRLEADGIHLLPEINIALAVDTERGLLTPVLRNVDRLGLQAIQAGFDALTARALAGQSRPDDFEAGTFTLTNLGSLDVDGFTPIINPPQAAILGVGRIIEKPVARDGAVVVRAMLTLSLSFDHRIVDGAPAGRFLQRIKQLVERPLALLV